MVSDAILDVTHRGDIVLDPFCGSGTTILAAQRTGRRGYAIELDPGHVHTVIARWERMTNQTALHASGKTFAEMRVDGSGERVSDGLEGADRLSAPGFDDGSDVGVLFCAPLGAEAGGRTRGGADDEVFAIVLDLGLGQRIQIGDDLRPGAPGSGARAIKKGLAFGSKESMNAHARGC